MSINEIYNDFLKYFEIRESKEQNPNEFSQFLHNFIENIIEEEEKRQLIEFNKQFEYCIDLKDVFPEYVKTKILFELDKLDFTPEKMLPINFFNIKEEETFYHFIKESELKYFSRLIPRPLSLILRHNLSSEEIEFFSKPLFHVINFKFWHDHSMYYLANNFKTVFREWEKEI